MKITKLTVLVSIALTGCNYSQTLKNEMTKGLNSKGEGLSCNNVYFTVNGVKTDRNTFIYGEEFLVNFNNIEGFKKENENVFPGMLLVVTSKRGDTVFQTNDLYSDYTKGMKISPLMLTANITVASPMKSKDEYTMHVNIWDKKGNGNFSAKFGFKVIPNKHIVTEINNVSYNEIFLYSQERDKIISDNKIRFNENTNIIFEGLSGFKEERGKVFPGLSLKATDNERNIILDYNDLFADYSKKGLDVSDFKTRISSHFRISGSEFKNPLHCNFTIWDKKSDARITSKADLIIE